MPAGLAFFTGLLFLLSLSPVFSQADVDCVEIHELTAQIGDWRLGILEMPALFDRLARWKSGQDCVSCGTVISEDGTHLVLDNDLLDCPQFGIMIDAADVTLDCQGHEITGGPDPQRYDSKDKENCSLPILDQVVGPSGVVVCRNEGGRYTIKNCVIHENFPGISYNGGIAVYADNLESEAGIIENNRIYNVGRGIMHWGDFDTIRGNTIENSETGIWFDETAGVLLENNTFSNCSVAVDHYCGSYCNHQEYPITIRNNDFVDNGISFAFAAAGDVSIIDAITGNRLSDSGNGNEVFAFGSRRHSDFEGKQVLLPSFNPAHRPVIDSSNTLNNAPIYYFKGDQLGAQITGDIGLFYCLECSNVSVSDASADTGKYGLLLFNSSNINISNTSIKNHDLGAFLYRATDTTINAEFENNNKAFVEVYSDGTNEICDGTTCYRRTCSLYSGIKASVGSLCEEKGCTALEQWCSGADLDKSRVVDGADADLLLAQHGRTDCSHDNGWCNGADIDIDGKADDTDLAVVLGNFGRTGCSLPDNVNIACYDPTDETPF